MALQMEKENINGFIGNYWKIAMINTIYQDGQEKVVVQLDLYKDKASRDSLKRPFESKTFIFSLSDLSEIRTAIYEKIKLEADFTTAIDVLES